jgi:hypothetical protein
LNDNLVEGGNTEEGCDGVETMVNDVEDSVGNVPAATEIADKEAEDEGYRIQS